jgi:hypothetical protein
MAMAAVDLGDPSIYNKQNGRENFRALKLGKLSRGRRYREHAALDLTVSSNYFCCQGNFCAAVLSNLIVQ